jgi:hypothetical protein
MTGDKYDRGEGMANIVILLGNDHREPNSNCDVGCRMSDAESMVKLGEFARPYTTDAQRAESMLVELRLQVEYEGYPMLYFGIVDLDTELAARVPLCLSDFEWELFEQAVKYIGEQRKLLKKA